MIYIHSLGRASRYYPERVALAPDGTRLTFRELDDRVADVAAALADSVLKPAIGSRFCFRTDRNTSNWCTRAVGWESSRFP